MNADIDLLQPYPFEKLATLKAEVQAPEKLSHIALSIGEPKHEPPAFVLKTFADQLSHVSKYPLTKGLPELREAIANWATQRFSLQANSLDPDEHVLPVAGTREALFSFTQAVVDRTTNNATVVCPNPFYQIYEGATLLAGATPYFANCDKDNLFLADLESVPVHIWHQTQLLFICSPGNPTGATLKLSDYQQIIELANRYDFIIASDECYSELYFDESAPPLGLLDACQQLGNTEFKRCVVFHSLSKRSNLPGLRSGFVAGDLAILSSYLKYRTYHGCALPVPTQLASIAAWQDEEHVKNNRDLYREKFSRVLEILNGCLEVTQPDAGFYLWAKTPIDDESFAQQLFAQEHITVLPGRYLARDTLRDSTTVNPGENYVRMALVATVEECVDAAQRIKRFVEQLNQ